MLSYRQLEVTTAEWWAGLAEWVIKAGVLIGAVTVLAHFPPTRRVIFAVGRWLWTFPLISMTVDGLRDLVRSEVDPLKRQIGEVGADVAQLRAENSVQHAEVTEQIARLAETVEDQNARLESHSKRLAAVESALMNRWRRGE